MLRSLFVSLILLVVTLGCGPSVQDIREMNESAAEPETRGESAEMSVFSVRDGDCLTGVLDANEIESVRIVPCSGAWQYKVLNSFVLKEQTNHPSQMAIDLQALEGCLWGYTMIIGPTRVSWEEFGDRTVNCLVAK